MTDEQKAQVAELKAAIAASARSTEGAPPKIRSAAVELKRKLQQAGTTATTFAQTLGVHVTTLCRWERDGAAAHPIGRRARTTRRDDEFRMVQVIEPTTDAAPIVACSTGLRATHAPSGLVVDGLDVDTLAALLRRMM